MAMQKRAIRTRENLIEAAGVRFAADGYTATTYAKIVADAGLAVGTMLFHFPAKRDIGRTVVTEAERLIIEAFETDGAGIAGVADAVTRFAELVASNPLVRAGLRLSAESVAELELEPAGPQMILLEHLTALLTSAHQRGEVPVDVDVSVLAETLVEVFFGACALSAALSSGEDLPERVGRALTVLLGEAFKV